MKIDDAKLNDIRHKINLIRVVAYKIDSKDIIDLVDNINDTFDEEIVENDKIKVK